MSEYGMPYMGSKDSIARSLCMNFPRAENFYDLFGGGGSITHCVMLTKRNRFKHFHYNEINSCTTELFKKSINGDYSYKRFQPPWVSREDFFRYKDTDGYIRCVWSFGNNQKTYLFSKEIEPYKRSMHMAIVFNQFDELSKSVLRFDTWPPICKTIKQKRFYLRQLIEHYRKTIIPKVLHQFLNVKQLQQLERLERLERLEQLNQLQQLERLERLERLEQLNQLQQLERLLSFTSLDYRQVSISPNSVVYCDIPYQATAEYLNAFDHKEFFDWAASRSFPVYISEYKIKDPRFRCVYEINKRVILTQLGDSNKLKIERLYWNQVSL